MERFKVGISAAGILFLCARLCSTDALATTTTATYSPCAMDYTDGGAPTVLQSSPCAAQWVPIVESLKKSMKNCQFATLQGHRKYQEDRVTCNLDIRIHFHGKDAMKEAKLDLLAIFDGHGGAEASEMANKHFLDYFLVHVVAGAFKKPLNDTNHQDLVNPEKSFQEIDDKSLHEILKEALVRAIRDIDSKFSLEAFRKRYSAGSTASVVLLLNDQELLIANLGDSKVILCAGNSMTEELTSDHRPDREDEQTRIQRAGGFVVDWDVPRVNGILAVSRAIGDVFLKRYGVIAEPELAGWRQVSAKDRYLVVASDGVFEFLTAENVCQVIQDTNIQENGTPDDRFPFLPSFSLANCVVKTALQKGSTDNLSAIVVPLAQRDTDDPYHKDEL